MKSGPVVDEPQLASGETACKHIACGDLDDRLAVSMAGMEVCDAVMRRRSPRFVRESRVDGAY